jgi:GTPase SAR1 family protein
MLMSYVVDKFPEIHSPTIYDKFSTSITVNGRRISVTMCDTAGQVRITFSTIAVTVLCLHMEDDLKMRIFVFLNGVMSFLFISEVELASLID